MSDASLQRAEEEPDPPPALDDPILHLQVLLRRRLREYYPEVVEIDDDSPLGRVLARLTEALAVSEPDHGGPAGFRDDLVGMVPRLRRYALTLTRDPSTADDLVQLTLLKAWEFRFRFEDGTNLVAWLFTILRNGHINGLRKHWREIPDPDGAQASRLFEPPSQHDRLDLQDLERALSRLDDVHREALTLVAVEGLTYQAAATVIGCPPGTVKSRVSRARDRLAETLGQR